jgi:hypothetical protein
MENMRTKRPDFNTYYPVRASNSLTDLKKWASWAKKNYPKQKIILVDDLGKKLKDKKMGAYWKMRTKAGYEHRYMAFGSFK